MDSCSATDQMKAVAEAVEAAGSQSALARLIGTTQATVWKWLNKGLPIKPELVLATEAATGISRHRLRPDVYGPTPTVAPIPTRPGTGDMEIAR
ncbi:transcriptional regulator [Sphingomonas sp. Leaf37]|uniref:transcriptional regulator n=1 Tax=Sphingomonas sp. Leaf37 TaxID=2876552 RepID=UPI002E780DE4|nr:YdaS family helix-turn-helix protein [Sphingomonas sp. Leaf37]